MNLRKIIKEEMEKYEHVDIVHLVYFPVTNQVLDKADWLDLDDSELPELIHWDEKSVASSTQWYYNNGFLDKYWKPDGLLKEVKEYYQDMANHFADEDRQYFQDMSDYVTIKSFIIKVGVEEIKTDSSFFDKL